MPSAPRLASASGNAARVTASVNRALRIQLSQAEKKNFSYEGPLQGKLVASSRADAFRKEDSPKQGSRRSWKLLHADPGPEPEEACLPPGDPPFFVQQSGIASRLWKLGLDDLAYRIAACGRSWSGLKCDTGGEVWYFSEICRFPLCETCRQEDSWAERTKKGRMMEKFARAEGLYKIVLTLPRAVRRKLMYFSPVAARWDRLGHEFLDALFEVAAEFALDVLQGAPSTKTKHVEVKSYCGVRATEWVIYTDKGAVEVTLHPMGDRGGFNPHFEATAVYWKGEWADPCAPDIKDLVREWLLDLRKRWAKKLQEDPRLALSSERDLLACGYSTKDAREHGVPDSVMVNGQFADRPGRIIHKVEYQIDHHWARRPEELGGRISDKALRFLAQLRGVRLSRGYGDFADAVWREFVASKPYAHKDLDPEREDGVPSDVQEGSQFLTFRDGCPVHEGAPLRFNGQFKHGDLRWGELEEVNPGVWVDKVVALLLPARFLRHMSHDPPGHQDTG